MKFFIPSNIGIAGAVQSTQEATAWINDRQTRRQIQHDCKDRKLSQPLKSSNNK